MKQAYFYFSRRKHQFQKTYSILLLTALLFFQVNFSFAQWTRKADALRKRSECPSVLYKNKIYVFG
ncbi:MAG: hypothetical protein M3Q05_07700, partial [Bacteroidota bacterium]|nr:hypothetical protein [Bacteroidota bacterium]